ncbi:hypothetical protein HNQ77_000451 [Silvibacterium bohemicum]|uniref:Glycerophosphoryl diester phosphodiesterase membrane domain-containing protein n=1 Tax=Silvibacterium bohemicum TaxID=1577686 RepID=A0A841JMQ0_9BACT|nr:hypothetical protein [Silvibacterium bohemicum]MBB6142513.1 hypothetical protein [Silvibacterium bohemicum]
MTVRGTQSFVHVIAECWRRPSLLLTELAWRWVVGVPLLLILAAQAQHIYAVTSAQLAASGIDDFTLTDPGQAAVISTNIYAVLAPPITHLIVWLAPAAAIVWAIVSAIGRNAVLRRYDSTLPSAWGSLSILQLMRVVFLGGSVWFWFAAIHWSADTTLGGDSPNIVAYCALVICLSLGIFTLWALVSWIFSIAPLLVLLENRGVRSSLARSFQLGPLKGKLVEINLIMGIIKLALVVLAMVFSACPLPFESAMQGAPLYLWWALVTVLYLAASDFFQVARLIAFIQLWRTFRIAFREP